MNEIRMENTEKAEKLHPEMQEMLEPRIAHALGNFRAAVHGWSREMMEHQTGSNEKAATLLVRSARRRTWRLAAAWSLASVLAMGAVSGALYERHQQQAEAQLAHQRLLEHQRELAAQKAKAEEDLLAKVESDISREVPSAMEPLAQLMVNDGTQTANAAQ
jgi:hypothetical protein